MNIEKWMALVLLGGVMGMLGQGIRSAIGLKKLRDQSGDNGPLFSENFSTSRFFASMFLGFVAGALSAFVLSDGKTELVADKTMLIGLMAAGYAGADTIEGLASKVIPTGVMKGTNPAS